MNNEELIEEIHILKTELEKTKNELLETKEQLNKYLLKQVIKALQRVLIIKLYAGMKRPNFEPLFFALFVRT